MQTSENSYAKIADRVFEWRIVPHTTVNKHTLICDFILLQQIHLQHGGLAAVTVVNRMSECRNTHTLFKN